MRDKVQLSTFVSLALGLLLLKILKDFVVLFCSSQDIECIPGKKGSHLYILIGCYSKASVKLNASHYLSRIPVSLVFSERRFIRNKLLEGLRVPECMI